MGFLKSESYRKGVISSTAFNLVAKGIGFINSLLIIYIFGSGLETDLYFLILATVTLITSFINGIDLLVLVPEAMRLRINYGEEAEKSFFNFFIRTYSFIGIVVTVLILLSPVLFYSQFSKFSTVELGGQHRMLLLSSVLFPIQLLNSLFISILTSHKYFTIPMISGLVNSIISISVLLLLNDSISVTGAVVAMLSGYIANFIWLIFYFKKELGWKFSGSSVKPSATVIKNIFLMELNILPVSLRSYITILLLTGLGTGVITAFNYGQQISLLPHALIATQIVAVIGVKFNELSSKNLHDDLDRLVNELLRLLYIVLLPVAAIMALLSTEAVELVFSYSKKIQAAAIDNIALVIFFMALTLPNMALDIALSRLLMSQQRIKEGVVYATLTHAVFVLLVFTGIKLYGLTGLLLALFCGYNIIIPLLYYLLLKKTAPFIKYLSWIISSIPFVLYNAALITVFFFTKKYLFKDFHPLITISVISTTYVAAVILFNRVSPYYAPLNDIINKYVLNKK